MSSPLLLLFATTDVERQAILAQRSEGAEPVSAVDVAALAKSLEAAADERAVVPAGITWLPSGDGRMLEALEIAGVTRPLAWMQRRVLAREPGRLRVVQGEPATVGELRRRWAGSEWSQEPFEDFVRRQGELAVDRAERALIGGRYKLPTQVRAEIARSSAFLKASARLAREQGRPEEEVREQALAGLDEMMTRQTRLGVDLFGGLAETLLRSYRIEYDAASLEQLEQLNKRCSLVFLPGHRSYLDPLVLGSVLRGHGFPPNHVLGGINLDFWPVGPVARRAGIVFIRRSIGDDEAYKLALRQYIGYLVEKRFNLEWYLEGGRSRSGKLRPPRYGLFAYLVDAFRKGDAEDVALIPTSIVYDQLHEAGDLAREARGGGKRRENLSYLVSYIRAQGGRFGAIHLSFGRPLMLREALEAAANSKLEVEKTAIEVAHRINEATPVTPTSLLTLALLGAGDRALAMSELRAVLTPLLDYVAWRKLPLTAPGLLRTEAGVREVLGELSRNHVVRRFDEGLEPVWGIGAEQHLLAAYYRNSAIHFFVDRAIAELARKAPGGLEQEALAIRDLLKFEFFFPRTEEHLASIRREVEGIEIEERSLSLAERVLGSFLEAYWILAERLARADPEAAVEKEKLLADALAAGRQYLLQRRVTSPEAVSTELFRGALRLAANRGLLEGDRRGREKLAAELATLVKRARAA